MKIWAIAHNALVHPMMAILPERWGTWLHDETARRAWPDGTGLEVAALAALERLGAARATGDDWGYEVDDAMTAVGELADRLHAARAER